MGDFCDWIGLKREEDHAKNESSEEFISSIPEKEGSSLRRIRVDWRNRENVCGATMRFYCVIDVCPDQRSWGDSLLQP